MKVDSCALVCDQPANQTPNLSDSGKRGQIECNSASLAEYNGGRDSNNSNGSCCSILVIYLDILNKPGYTWLKITRRGHT